MIVLVHAIQSRNFYIASMETVILLEAQSKQKLILHSIYRLLILTMLKCKFAERAMILKRYMGCPIIMSRMCEIK